MTAVEVLRKAKALLEERGWCRDRYQNRRGELCARGSCYAAAGATFVGDLPHLDGHEDACIDAQRALARALDLPGRFDIAFWNDADGRTKDEVLAAFDRTIALAEASS